MNSMRYFLLTILFGLFLLNVQAQDVVQEMKVINKRKPMALDTSGWKKSGQFVFELTQASLTNWSNGGEKFMLGVNALLDYSIHHRMGKYVLDAYFDIEMGAVEAASFHNFRKTLDRCDITIEFDHTMGEKLYYGLLANINTQFFPGRTYTLTNLNTKISSFLTPGKIILSPGIDYKDYNKQHYFSVFISPLTARWVTKRDPDFLHLKKFGVDSASRFMLELGPYLSIHLSEKFKSGFSYTGRLDLFSNYRHKPQNMDVLFHNLLSFAIAKKFSANFLIDLIYDDDIKKRVQMLQTFGLGLKLKL